MVTLLVISVILGMTAPLFTKRVQGGGRTTQRVESVPKGAIMFFDPDEVAKCPEGWIKVSDKYNGRYFKISGDYEICDKHGEDKDGKCVNTTITNENTGEFIPKSNLNNSPGTLYGDVSRKLWGDFTTAVYANSYDDFTKVVYIHRVKNFGNGSFNIPNEKNNPPYLFTYLALMTYSSSTFNVERPPIMRKVFLDSSTYLPTGDENMPRSIAMLACKKK